MCQKAKKLFLKFFVKDFWEVTQKFQKCGGGSGHKKAAFFVRGLPLGCLPPRGQSENKIRGVLIPPSYDPRNTILKGILIWSSGRPPPNT